MIDTLLTLLVILAILAAHALAMRWLWRRMKRVKAVTARIEPDVRPPVRPGFEDPDQAGRFHGQSYVPNDALIDQGAGAREPRWPIN